MILKAARIAELLAEGAQPDAVDPLVITPHPEPGVIATSGSASIDLRLGTWFVTLREARMSHLRVDDRSPEAHIAKTRFVPYGEEYFLHPRSFVLSVSVEWIRLPKDLAAYVVGRSSWGRRGLIIATATGVHPGFTGCLTLELTNVGEIPIAIKPGMTVCQLFLHRVEHSSEPHTDASQFLGLRKPTIGPIELDEIARKLAAASQPTSP